MSGITKLMTAGGGGVSLTPASSIASDVTVQVPSVNDTLVGLAATQTLTNKTLTSPTLTTPNFDSAQVATVSGAAPLYMCRAWVNFNGTGTVAISASGNVSSITDNGTGDYTVNFTTAMPDANYSFNVTQGMTALTTCVITGGIALAPATTTSRRFGMYSSGTGAATDMAELNVAVFR